MSGLNVGLAGCGRFSQLVFLNLLTQPSWKLVAIAESNPERREAARKQVKGAVVVENYWDLLALPAVDAIIVSLPSAIHADAAVAAFQQGKHVYLEKPIATTLHDAQRVITAWKDAGVVGMMGLNYRFHPLNQAAKQYLQSGKLGKLVCVRSVFASPLRTLPAWQQCRETGGGALLHLASHHIDLMRFLFDAEVQTVFATVRSQHYEADTAALQLQLSNGLLIQSFFSHSAVREDRLEIYGEVGKLVVDRYQSFGLEFTPADLKPSRFPRIGHKLRSLIKSPLLLQKFLNPQKEPSYKAALNHFVAVVQGKTAVTTDLWDGYRSLLVVEAAEKSANTGMVVEVSD